MDKSFEEYRLLSKFSKNLDFGKKKKITNISIFVEIFENVDLGQNFRKISILVTIFKNLDFTQMFGNLDIGQRFRKNLDFGKIFVNLDFCQHFEKLSRF